MSLAEVRFDGRDRDRSELCRRKQQLDCDIRVVPRAESSGDGSASRCANFSECPRCFTRDFMILGERGSQVSDGRRVAQQSQRVRCIRGDSQVAITQ
jgi:hypothetical protein